MRILWHTQSAQDLTQQLEVDPSAGLAPEQWTARHAEFGANQITQQRATSAWRRLFEQCHNPLIYILLIAVAVTGLLQEWLDAGVILAVVVANVAIGYVQEARAEQAILSLQSLLSAQAVVIRAGKREQIRAQELVPGDIVLLSSGDRVPADLRLLHIQDLQIDESGLTGESVSVLKQTGELAADTPLSERHNMAYGGTLVTYGSAQGVVVAIGDATETGHIATLIAQAVQIDTPLTRQIKGFSRTLVVAILVLAGLTFGLGVWQEQAWADTFMAAVALAVATIPEGLPAVLTITLAMGVRRMAGRHAIVRRLPAVETLGATTRICSDKTGTLTANQMTVQRVWAGQEAFTLSGSGFAPEGQICSADGQPMQALPPPLAHCLSIGLLCNDSDLVCVGDTWQVRGDPTEGALLAAARKAGLSNRHPRLDTLAFESDRQYMATLHQFPDGSHHILVKGSVEQIVKRCAGYSALDTTPWRPQQVLRQAEVMAADGLRVLAFASLEVSTETTTLDGFRQSEAMAQLQFVGLQGMIDPPRPEAIAAVATCQSAGIRVSMITGDHALTAQAIAVQLGIAGAEGKVLTGQDLARMKPKQWAQVVRNTAVFARVAPEQKLALVNALQAQGEVVAMTGDGVNDAPALKQADIGIAMGQAGTEVAREASDMVLTNDNFASITAAVEEGRAVFDNLSKFITWILPTNLGQGLVIFLAILLGVTLPVLPVQALWLNLTTAIFLGLMLAFEPQEAGIMQRPPRPPGQPILNTEIIGRIISVSVLLLIGAFGLFQWALLQGEPIEVARSLAVTLFVVVQSLFLLNCRGRHTSLWRMPLLSNPWIWLGLGLMLLAQLAFLYLPWMNVLFQSAPLSLEHWLLMGLYGFWVMLMVEGEKSLWRWRRTLIARAEANT